MAGIAMCLKKDCPSFYNCYRAQAVANTPWQTYNQFDNKGKAKCDDFIAMTPERKHERNNT